jgi:hypothetical protein
MSSNKSGTFLSDFGINSAEVMSKAILTAPKANWKHNYNVSELFNSNLIVLSASMFGAIYLFSASLIGLNKKWIKQEKSEVTAFEIINGTIMFLSGGIVFFTSIKAYNILLNK